MLSNIPEEYWLSETTTFLDPCFGTGAFLDEVARKLLSYGHDIKKC